jgi:hypothetical protein
MANCYKDGKVLWINSHEIEAGSCYQQINAGSNGKCHNQCVQEAWGKGLHCSMRRYQPLALATYEAAIAGGFPIQMKSEYLRRAYEIRHKRAKVAPEIEIKARNGRIVTSPCVVV